MKQIPRTLWQITVLLLGSTPVVQAQSLFGINSGSSGDFLALIDPSNGNLTNIGPTGFHSDGLAFSSDGRLYAADNTNGQLVTLNPATGAVDMVIGFFNTVGTGMEGLAFHPTTGVLYAIANTSNQLATVSTTTGQATLIGPLNCCQFGMAGLAWSLDGSSLYGIDWISGCLYTINPATGNATSIGCDDASEPLGLAIDPSNGQLYSVDWQGGSDMILSRVSATNGSRVDVGFMVGGVQVEGITFEVMPFGTNYCVATVNSTGAASSITATGSASISANNLVLSADNLPSQPGIFIAGPGQTQIPFFNGFLCIDPIGLQRFLSPATPAAGVITEAVDYGASAAGGLNVVAGSTHNFQRWNRDPAGGGNNANFSDGLAVAMVP